MDQIHVPRPGAWGSTGATTPRLSGSFAPPPGNWGARQRREVLAKLVWVMYACVGSAQTMERSSEEQVHALHQMVLANAALASGEADTLLTLISAGMDGPAMVHLRALGELATRIGVCRERPDLAFALYKSWGASYEQLLGRHFKDVVVDGAALTEADKEMRALEESWKFKKVRSRIVKRDGLPSSAEREIWSKRTHGDIYALVHVSLNLHHRGDDVRAPVLQDQPYEAAANIALTRGVGLALYVCKHMIETFGLAEAITEIEPCIGLHQHMIEQDRKLGEFAWSAVRGDVAPTTSPEEAG